MFDLTNTTNSMTKRDARVRGFTLVELLVVIAIVGILASMMTVALGGASQTAKRRRTETQVQKIHEFIAEKWESYETRSVQIPASTGNRRSRNLNRLIALRELMRLELPDRVSDVLGVTPDFSNPSLHRYYQNRAARSVGWTTQHQGAECLYLILSRIENGDGTALDAFGAGEIGDTDNDGMPEILDGWGNPMQFVRWPAGYLEPSTYQDPDSEDLAERGSDPFDFTGVFEEERLNGLRGYRIFPLVFSNGPDGNANIVRDGNAFHNDGGYSSTTPPNDPYTDIDFNGALVKIGSLLDVSSDDHFDNITNHALGLDN